MLVNVARGPQPYFILERTIVEASQVFGAKRLSPAPVSVSRLGLEASWFPAEQWLMATDGYRLITASVEWRGARQSREIALATAATRPYLHRHTERWRRRSRTATPRVEPVARANRARRGEPRRRP